jgi:hypothetical protein
LNSIEWELKTSEDNKEQLGFVNEVSGYTCRYVITHEGGYTPILPSFINRVSKEQIFIGFWDGDTFKDGLTIPLINFPTP